MPRKKKPPTDQEPDLKTQDSAEKQAEQPVTEHSQASIVSHVPHSVIALSVLVIAIGTLTFGYGIQKDITWLIIVGITFTIVGGFIYLLPARQAENKSNGFIVLLLWIVLLIVGLKYFNVLPSNLLEGSIATQQSVAPPTPLAKSSPSPDSEIRILKDGRIVSNVTPESFTEREKSGQYTSAQIQEINDSYVGKWIMFSGTVYDALYRPKSKDLAMSVMRGETIVGAYFTNDKQIASAKAIKKGDPITVLCKIVRTKAGGIGFWDCENI